MKYKKEIEKIRSGAYTRAQLSKIRSNAEIKLHKGDVDAGAVIDEIDRTSPTDKTMVFMGFCPGADFDNRQDIAWKDKGICTFIYYDSAIQVERFSNIWPGDLIILKKRHVIGKTMKLYGHGRVTGVQYNQDNRRFLEMNWSSQNEIIEVPLMACNATVDIRTIEQVEADMPDAFFKWLEV